MEISSSIAGAMIGNGWRRIENKPFTCQCCGQLVILGWAGGHKQMCDTCLGHWRTDYFCDAKTYAKSLNDRTYLTAED
jgi:hypothetical protein